MNINGIILSAGLSSRMDAFKPLLIYNKQTFISSILQKIYPVCERIGIVTGYKNDKVNIAIENSIHENNLKKDKIKLIYNPEFEKGMFLSLETGMKELSQCDWLLYHFVDQPHIPKAFYPEFKNQIENGYDWIQPAFSQKKGHPILLNKSLFSKILDSNINSLKEISHTQSIKKKIWNCAYPQIVEDIDTQDDYQKLT